MTEGPVPDQFNEYTVVTRARSSARFKRDEGFEFNLRAPDLPAHVRVRMTTRWVPSGFAEPIPRELIIEVVGRAESIDRAISVFTAIARSFSSLAAYVANTQVGRLETHIAYDSTSAREERDFVEAFLPDESGGLAEGRAIDLDLITAVSKAYFEYPEPKRIVTAIHQYQLALRDWYLGGEYLALSHLWMAAEALTELLLLKHVAAKGTTKKALAESVGFEVEGARRGNWPRLLEAWCRRVLIFQEDDVTYTDAKDASDGFEHGYLEMGTVAQVAMQRTETTFKYIRVALADALGLPADQITALEAIPPQDVQSFRKVPEGRLTNAADGILAPEGEDYPRVEWHSRIGAVTVKDGGLSVETKEILTLRTAKTVGLKDIQMRFFGRPQDGRLAAGVLDTPGELETGHTSLARDLLTSTMDLLNETASNGTAQWYDFPTIYAFNIFAVGCANFEATKALLERDQPVEAVTTLRLLVTAAARLEQITAQGIGIAIRDALDHFAGLAEMAAQNTQGDRQQYANEQCQYLLDGALAKSIPIPDTLPPVEEAEIWKSLGAEMNYADGVARAGYFAALLHMRPASEGGAAFHTALKQDDFSDLIASAAVLAQLANLLHAAEVLGWPYDSARLNAAVDEAKRLNESASGASTATTIEEGGP